MPLILDGKMVAAHVKENVFELIQRSDVRPKLAVILVGDNPASQVYVRNKQRDCKECGIQGVTYTLPESTSESRLIELVASLSMDASVHGILVQLPLPKHINADCVIAAIAPEKDVDCFTPYNVGLLNQGHPKFVPCTPGGVVELLSHYDIGLAGKHCVIVGRSNIVGKPMAALLLQHDATVTVCHSHANNLSDICKTADVLISAVGKLSLIQPSYVKEGTVLIDVGMNRDADGKLCGDCDPAAYERAYAHTPVPGGVGPMTRAMLIANTSKAAGLDMKD